MHRLGDDPLQQETIRLWDSGVILVPSGETVYLGQVASEVLVQQLGIYSYWSGKPVAREAVQQLDEETHVLQSKWGDESMLLLREPLRVAIP